MKRPTLTGLLLVLVAATTAAAESRTRLDFALAPNDEPGTYSWGEAIEACEAKGMALPAADEMAQVFCHAKLSHKNVVARYPQVDGGCRESGISGTFPNFKEKGRYWTASRYNDGVVRYLDFLDGQLGYYGKDERLNVRCIRPREPSSRTTRSPYPYHINDVDRGSFHYIVDTVFGLYREEFARSGKRLVIKKRWVQEEENARSWLMEMNDREADRIVQVREIELIGGLARHPMLNRDAYALVVCHEVGHHLGGAPFALGYSAEGQSDYFAGAKCMKRYLELAHYRQPYREALPQSLAQQCADAYAEPNDQALCERNILAGRTLARWIAHSRDIPLPRLTTPDPAQRDSTLVHGYPTPQCRLDTLVAGALCPLPAEQAFAYDDPAVGACTRAAGYEAAARPRCWFDMDSLRVARTAADQHDAFD